MNDPWVSDARTAGADVVGAGVLGAFIIAGVNRLVVFASVALLLLLVDPTPVQAQQPLRDVLSFLLTNQSVPTGDFVKDAEAAAVTRDTMTRLLAVELSTLPISSSSPGFVYRLNRELGVSERASESFGPFFSERALTAGRGQASFGLSLRVASFTHLDGQDLRDGGFITSGNTFRDESQPFDIETLTLELDSRTVTAFANVGVTDRLDVGAAIPLVSIEMQGRRVNTYRGQVLQQASARARATGLGDIALRAKYRLYDVGGSGLAAVAETRLPTGDAENLLGAGEASLRTLVIGSMERGRVGLHANAGFSIGGLADDVQYRTAASVSASPHVTFVGELLGRRIADVGRTLASRAPHPGIDGVDTIRLITTGASTHTTTGLAGVKWNVGGMWLVSGSVAWPLTSGGLRPGPTLQIGLDYALPIEW